MSEERVAAIHIFPVGESSSRISLMLIQKNNFASCVNLSLLTNVLIEMISFSVPFLYISFQDRNVWRRDISMISGTAANDTMGRN